MTGPVILVTRDVDYIGSYAVWDFQRLVPSVNDVFGPTSFPCIS